MTDLKVAGLAVATMTAASAPNWLETADTWVHLVMTLLVGGASLVYTILRIRKLWKERDK